MSPISATPYPKTANEPKVHPLIRKGFVFVPSAGMRLAPEILVLELMREVFFECHYGEPTGTRDLNPDELDEERRPCFPKAERAVLHALRGRRKKSKNATTQPFFAPAYPQLAKRGWLGKNRERVVNNFLLSGPIAQYLWCRGADSEDGKRRQGDLVDKVWRALLGNNSCLGQEVAGKELLAVALGAASFDASGDLPLQNLREKTGDPGAVFRIDDDELARRITEDLVAICDLEPRLPRMQWLQLLMTFLRFALPMWLLAQMQITKLVHGWLLDAMDRGRIANAEAILCGIASRNRGLLHPTLTPTRELFEHVERYMKCRVETSILLYCLVMARRDQLEGRTLNLGGGGRDVIGIDGLLTIAMNASGDVRRLERYVFVADGLDVQAFLTREGEQFSAWRNPLMSGQGKNIDEFFRVLYRAELGDEAGGYLVAPEGRGSKRGFRVFPGQLLLKTVTYLAGQRKWSGQQRGGGGKLVLQDVEDHFCQYGIDFSTAADARPLLMKELQAMGLLTGSPDAGSSVAVACPY